MMTDRSQALAASTTSRPMPWMLKMFSTMTLPPMRPGRIIAIVVIIGMRLLRSAWR